MGSEIKPRIGQGRVGIKCKKPQSMKNVDALFRQIAGNTEKTCYSKHS